MSRGHDVLAGLRLAAFVAATGGAARTPLAVAMRLPGIVDAGNVHHGWKWNIPRLANMTVADLGFARTVELLRSV
jgi:hypothetical protein